MLIISAAKRFLLLCIFCPAVIGIANTTEDIADMVVAQDGSGDFTKVQDAINAVPSNKSIQTVIFIKPGTYKEKINVSADKKNLKFLGESYENTVLTYDDHAKKTKNYASTRIYADDFCAENVTFQNTIDSRKGGSQAAALRVDGDRAVFYKCRIMGFQDTYYTGGNKRSYHRDCVIIGTTDFIYGDGIALFENCTIYNRKDSHVTAHCQKLKDGKSQNEFGYVFKHCKIKAYPGETVTKASLGRPWGNGARVVYLYCEIGSHIRDEGWSIWRGRENHKTAYYAEYKNSGPGHKPESRLDWTHQLTDEEAAAYTKENIFKANTTTAVTLEGDWNPNVDELVRSISTSTAGSTLPAFPGAEGYGSLTRGGRGGKVIAVTNLNDSGPGSLRAAVEAKGPRIVVFRVSGTIKLEKSLTIRNPYITIAGQTAPGDGICLRDQQLSIGADEVIIRYIRMRLGDESDTNSDAIGGRGQKNIILDHVSASWSIDECVSIYGCENVTIQWCLISESLYQSKHKKGHHGFGGIWGNNYGSYHHNLIAHHSSRNPRWATDSGYNDYRNNVLFNWGYNSSYGGEGDTTVNIVANYYKPGPATSPGNARHRIVNPSAGKYYVAENYVEGNATVTADNWAGGVQPRNGDLNSVKLAEPWDAMAINQQSAEDAYRSVLKDAGATLPRRDSVDIRVIEGVRTGKLTVEGSTYETQQKLDDPSLKCGIIDSQSDVGGWPELKSLSASADRDSDGMPDEWENKHGLNLNDAGDNAQDKDNDGYTNVEEYLNGTDPTEFVDYTKPENNINTLM